MYLCRYYLIRVMIQHKIKKYLPILKTILKINGIFATTCHKYRYQRQYQQFHMSEWPGIMILIKTEPQKIYDLEGKSEIYQFYKICHRVYFASQLIFPDQIYLRGCKSHFQMYSVKIRLHCVLNASSNCENRIIFFFEMSLIIEIQAQF